ncbi:NAD(P)/FAD-dependent oxidoreductase [Nitratiruptor tergarcus]|uniref:NADH dehydrogenase n=1 Tax=Nitratiruptor tergarcus DSM 16512 TaxID=1069081 RepID=A0A1W1WTZ4_9BACT|nr:FAD-dependent oxidoreductase [Nitratiruptor tergarcus]SMC09788.1 NADH dehydrogenase [Nitratiruptor tergarcus DSM 16512]
MRKVVVIGGGYGGIKALEEFARNDQNIEVTLIDQHTYHYLQTESYDLVASKIPIQESFIYLPTLVASFGENFHFIHDEAVVIKEDQVVCKGGTYPFDYCIIATGSVTKFLQGFEKKGKHSLGVKSLRAALHIKQYFEEELFARLEPKRAQRSFRVIVIGGGLSGVEIAAEMRCYFNQYVKENALSCGNIEIQLLSKHILKGLSEKTRDKAVKRLRQLSVSLVPQYVNEITEQKAILSSGETIDFDFAIFAGGIEPSPFIQNLENEKDARGFLVVDEYLRVEKNIFAVGDVAVLKDKEGNLIPPTAQSAEQSGVIAAKNILQAISNQPLQRANIRLRGLAIALGGKYAIIVTPFGFQISGILGWIGKKAIEKWYKWPLKLKAKQGFEKLTACKGEK